jgi:SAM-dependent methyltransferase
MNDFSELKTRQQGIWSSGNYSAIGVTLQIVGETLCEAADLRAGWRVLDVAAGNGNATLAAARRGCEVVSTDYVPALLERGRARAEAEGLAVSFQTADAEALPFAEASFDAVLSTYGVMFTPDQAQAAAEMLRVCRPGGRIALASWTPESFIGQVLATVGRQMPPPPEGVRPPSRWGTKEGLADLFPTDQASPVSIASRDFTFRYRSTRHWLDTFRRFYGPTLRAFDTLPEDRGAALADELLVLADRFNRAEDGTMILPSPYLEAVLARK